MRRSGKRGEATDNKTSSRASAPALGRTPGLVLQPSIFEQPDCPRDPDSSIRRPDGHQTYTAQPLRTNTDVADRRPPRDRVSAYERSTLVVPKNSYGVANARGRMGDWAKAAETAIRHARAAGFYWGDSFGLTTALASGPTPADEALQAIDEFGIATTGLVRGYLLGSLGRFEEAWALALAAADRYEQSRDHRQYGSLSELAALEGDYETAVRYQEQHVEGFEGRRARRLRRVLRRQARALALHGRYRPDEAEPLVDLARTVEGQETDWLWRQASARALAHRGEHAEAEARAREAVAGRIDKAVETYGLALERYERKRNLAMVAQAQQRLDDVRQPQRPTP
jgi:tetratricopeptide (TPR) repeat protein